MKKWTTIPLAALLTATLTVSAFAAERDLSKSYDINGENEMTTTIRAEIPERFEWSVPNTITLEQEENGYVGNGNIYFSNVLLQANNAANRTKRAIQVTAMSKNTYAPWTIGSLTYEMEVGGVNMNQGDACYMTSFTDGEASAGISVRIDAEHITNALASDATDAVTFKVAIVDIPSLYVEIIPQ